MLFVLEDDSVDDLCFIAAVDDGDDADIVFNDFLRKCLVNILFVKVGVIEVFSLKGIKYIRIYFILFNFIVFFFFCFVISKKLFMVLKRFCLKLFSFFF